MSENQNKYSDTHYITGEEIRIGDIVEVAGARGTVAFVVKTGQYSDKFPKAVWDYLGEGFMVESQKYGLVHHPHADEDFVLVQRAAIS